MRSVRYFKPTTAMRDAAVTIADRRAQMKRVVRDAVRVVVEVVPVGDQSRSVCSKMFGIGLMGYLAFQSMQQALVPAVKTTARCQGFRRVSKELPPKAKKKRFQT